MLAPKFVEFPPKKLKFYQNKIKNASHTPPKKKRGKIVFLTPPLGIYMHLPEVIGRTKE